MSEHVAPTGNLHDENPDPRAFSTVMVGLAGVLITVLVVIGLEVIYYRTAQAEITRKEIELVSPELEAMRQQQADRLDHYRWVDQEAGTVAIPIDRAIELIVEEHGNP